MTMIDIGLALSDCSDTLNSDGIFCTIVKFKNFQMDKRIARAHSPTSLEICEVLFRALTAPGAK